MTLYSCNSWLNHVLDKHEARSGNGRAEALRPDLFINVSEFEKLSIHIKDLIKNASLKPHFGKHARRNVIEKITIIDPKLIYELIERTPSDILTEKALYQLRSNAQSWEFPVLNEIKNAWIKNKPWQNIYLKDYELLLPVQKLAQALHNGEHNTYDQRSFAAKTGDNSKLLEKKNGLIASYLYAGDANAIEKLNELFDNDTNRKISLPIIMAGAFLFNDKELADGLDYYGIPFHQTERIKVSQKCEYILTIENMTSFHRHVIEVNNIHNNGLILYTGGQPSSAFKRFYRDLTTNYGDTLPFYHWSDIDQGGLEITNSLRIINNQLRLHLMSKEIALAEGVKSEKFIINIETFENTVLEDLAIFLTQDNCKTLEQERIEPCLPT